MLGRRRLYHFALGIVLALTAQALGQDSGQPVRPEKNLEATQQTQHQPTALPAVELPTAVQPAPTEPPGPEQNYNTQTESHPEPEKGFWQWKTFVSWSDPLPQWIMAFSGVLALWISVWAVFLVKKTLDATRESVKEARCAASNAYHAAQQANLIMEDTARRQLRAYVGVKESRLSWENGRAVGAHVRIINAGQTPAYDMTYEICIAAGKREKFNAAPENLPHGKHDLFPGVAFNCMIVSRTFPKEVWEGIRNKTIPIYIWGEIIYRDAFEITPRSTKFRLILIPHIPGDIETLSPCDEGNEST